MAYDENWTLEHFGKADNTPLLNEREKHLIGLAVTMTHGCQVCPQNRIGKARQFGISDSELNATARVAFGLLEQEKAAAWGDISSPTPAQRKAAA